MFTPLALFAAMASPAVTDAAMTDPYPVAEVIPLVQSTCAVLPTPAQAPAHYADIGWQELGESSHADAKGSKDWQSMEAERFDAQTDQYVNVLEREIAGQTLHAIITLGQQNGTPVRRCSVVHFDEPRKLAPIEVAGLLGSPVPEATETHGQEAYVFDLADQAYAQTLTVKYFRPTESSHLNGIQFYTSYQEGDAT